MTSYPEHAERAEGVHLDGVSETTLWTLYQRAAEAARPDCVLHDPMAVELVEETRQRINMASAGRGA